MLGRAVFRLPATSTSSEIVVGETPGAGLGLRPASSLLGAAVRFVKPVTSPRIVLVGAGRDQPRRMRH